MTDGSTIRNIAEGHHIVTARPQTDLGEQREVIRSPTGKPVRGNNWAGRAAMCRVAAAEDLA